MIKRLLLVLLWLAAGIPARAEVLRYTDSSGQIHYVDRLESIPPEYRKQASQGRPLPRISKLQAPQYATVPAAPVHDSSSPSSTKTVEIFVASWCPHCRALEKFLKEKHIRYSRYDIENDARAANMYKKLGGGGIPVVRIGSTVMRGFQPNSIAEALRD